MTDEIRKVFNIIQERKKTPKKGSYTTSLFEEGENRIISKIMEESSEVIKAATKEGNKRLIEEIDDLFYHVFVLMVERGLTLADLEKEEEKRMKK
jgi:phosphoribosyl-ATP pyrophosphohydrolase